MTLLLLTNLKAKIQLINQLKLFRENQYVEKITC